MYGYMFHLVTRSCINEGIVRYTAVKVSRQVQILVDSTTFGTLSLKPSRCPFTNTSDWENERGVLKGSYIMPLLFVYSLKKYNI